MLTVAVLGALEVTRDGRPVAVPAGKTSELVVRLALEPGELVRADRLVEDLWAADGVSARRNTLQSKITMLRRALGDPALITSRDGGYALAVEPSDVDALAALSATTTASGLFEAGDDEGAADLCASTLRLYRGDVLQAAGDGDWVTPYRARLDEARLTLLEIQFGARMRLGEVGDVIGELEAAVAAHPFQESLWELLITAQYRAGRQADALASYQKVRTLLAAELGLDPRPQLQELEHRILVQDAALEVPVRPAARARTPRRAGNLPSMAAELVGREDEVAAMSDLLARERLVEIVGPGGIGKTAVAIAVGRELTASSPLASRWRLAGQARERQHAGPGRRRAGRCGRRPRRRDGAVRVVQGRLRGGDSRQLRTRPRRGRCAGGAAPRCRPGAADPVHQPGPARRRRRGRLRARPADARPTASSCSPAAPRRNDGSRAAAPDTEPVRDLCRSLDGLPLAIELAAARTKTLSVEEITRRLDDPFLVLADPTSRKPERRRSLRSTISWSYDLLFPDDQRGLWALATFAGGAPLPAVEFVLEALDVPAAAAIDVVGRLASRSLVTRRRPRVRLLMRAVATRCGTGCWTASGRSRSRPCPPPGSPSVPERRTPPGSPRQPTPPREGVRGARQAEHLAFARTERANIEAALAWGAVHDPMLALRIVNGFGWAWVVLGDSRGAQRILTALDAVRRRGSGPGPGQRPAARGVDRGVDRPSRPRPPPHRRSVPGWPRRPTTPTCRPAVPTTSPTSSPITASSAPRWSSPTAAGPSTTRWTGRGTRPRTGCSPPERRSLPGDEHRAVDAADRVQHWLEDVEDPWLHVRGEAMLGELARLQHRFDDAVHHLGRAADRSRQLGFQQTEAYQVDQPGPGPVPGRGLRRRRGHLGARDREGPGHRRRASGGARASAPGSSAEGDRTG